MTCSQNSSTEPRASPHVHRHHGLAALAAEWEVAMVGKDCCEPDLLDLLSWLKSQVMTIMTYSHIIHKEARAAGSHRDSLGAVELRIHVTCLSCQLRDPAQQH